MPFTMFSAMIKGSQRQRSYRFYPCSMGKEERYGQTRSLRGSKGKEEFQVEGTA